MHYLVVVVLIVLVFGAIRYLLKSRNNVNQERPQRVYHDEECPICLEDQTYPVQASCGHEFCGSL